MKIDERDTKIAERNTKIDQPSPHQECAPQPECAPPPDWQPGRFEHERLDAFQVARKALCDGERVARRLPRGHATLVDQLRRALLSAYLGVAEAASRSGADRTARFRCARGEAAEAAAALDAVVALGLLPASQVQQVLVLLRRLCAMLTRLSRPAR